MIQEAKDFDVNEFKYQMSIEGPDKHSWKIFDIKYYENDIEKFEKFYTGEIQLGPIKITRQFLKCDDRLAKTKHDDEYFAYYTKMENTEYSEDQTVATMVLIHGFCENSSVSFFEMGLHHALNGLEVHMIDQKCFGYTHGARCSKYTVYDMHEQIGTCLQQVKSNRPLFMLGHSMGSMNITTFLAKNPKIKPTAVILSAPFFEYAQMNEVGFIKQLLVKSLKPLGDELILNPILQAHWVCHDKNYWRRLNEFDGTVAPFINAKIADSMGEAIRDIKANTHK